MEGRVRTVASDCTRFEVVPRLERILLAAPLVEDEDVEGREIRSELVLLELVRLLSLLKDVARLELL